MKKRIVPLLVIACMLLCSACGNGGRKNSTENGEIGSEDIGSQEIGSEETEESTFQSQEEPETEEDSSSEDQGLSETEDEKENESMYFDSIILGEKKSGMTTSLFGGNFSMPLDYYEVGRFCQPLIPNAILWDENHENMIDEFAAIEDAVAYNDTVDAWHPFWLSPSQAGEDIGIKNLRIVDKSEGWTDQSPEKETTVSECLEHNYWMIEFDCGWRMDRPHQPDVLNAVLGTGLTGDYSNIDVLNAMTEKNGAPTFILDDPHPNGDRKFDKGYWLAYEYDDYAIVFYIGERAGDSEINILEAYYYTTELWEYEKIYIQGQIETGAE